MEFRIGEEYTGNDIRLTFPWSGHRVCGGVAKIADHKWLPLVLVVNRGPGGHFRSIAQAFVSDTRTYKTAKLAAKTSVEKARDEQN